MKKQFITKYLNLPFYLFIFYFLFILNLLFNRFFPTISHNFVITNRNTDYWRNITSDTRKYYTLKVFIDTDTRKIAVCQRIKHFPLRVTYWPCVHRQVTYWYQFTEEQKLYGILKKLGHVVYHSKIKSADFSYKNLCECVHILLFRSKII